MKISLNFFVFGILYLFFLNVFPISSSTIEQEIRKISKISPGVVGVVALHIEKKQRVVFNGDVKFPMASTYKLPIALYCLSLVDKGKINLFDIKVVKPYDLRRYCYMKLGQSVSVRKLIKLMIEKSDNATSDIILKLVGGGDVVTDWLKKNGIYSMSVDRSTLKMLADYYGIKNLGDENNYTVDHEVRLRAKVSDKKRLKAQSAFYDDTQDTTTPNAMVDLLEKIYYGKLLSKQSKKFLDECMLKCKWGKSRIKRFLPKKTKIWHKTGRVDGIVSDVGIIELPQNKGHLAIAIYTNRAANFSEKQELVIAKISKLLFDYFKNLK